MDRSSWPSTVSSKRVGAPVMRLLHVRFTILGLMLGVAVIGLLLTLAVRMHPQPVRVEILNPEGSG